MEDEKRSREAAYLDYLRSHQEDRGMMAELRRGFNKDTEHRTWPYIAKWCDLTNDKDRIITQTIGAAFATNPNNITVGNIGTSLKQFVKEDSRSEGDLKTFEPRFRRILSCKNYREVCQLMPGIFRSFNQKGIKVNYLKLYNDLRFWRDKIKQEWASEFWKDEENSNEIPE